MAIKKQMRRQGGEDKGCPQRECNRLPWEFLSGNHVETINLQHGKQDHYSDPLLKYRAKGPN